MHNSFGVEVFHGKDKLSRDYSSVTICEGSIGIEVRAKISSWSKVCEGVPDTSVSSIPTSSLQKHAYMVFSEKNAFLMQTICG